MNFDIINSLKEILNEDSPWDKAEDRANSFIADSRSRGTHAKDIVKDSVKEDSKDSEEEEDKEIVKKISGDDELSDDKEVNMDVGTPDESPSTISLSNATSFDELVRSLNQFRASHSLSDPEVSEEMKKYFNKLTPGEKYVLYIFMKGLTQVTLMDVDGSAAYSPRDLKFDITKNGSATSEKRKSIARKQKSKEEAERLSNTPVKIGENKQDKSGILEVFKRNNA